MIDNKEHLNIGVYSVNTVITDPYLLDILNRYSEDERARIVDEAIGIGIPAIDRASTGSYIDFVEKEFLQLNTETQEKLNDLEKFLGKTINTLEEKLDHQVENFEKSILELIGEDGKLYDALDPNIENNIFEAFQRSIQELLSLEIEKSPLRRLKSEILQGQQTVASSLSALIGANVEAEKGTQKGFKFEEDVHDVLAPAVRNFGDTIEYVGDKPNGKNGSGDYIIVINDPRLSSQRKIVIEAKDYKSITLRKLRQNVVDAISNRNTDAGIGVVRNCTALPKKVGCFSEVSQEVTVCSFESDGTVLVAAYRLMRADVITKDLLDNQDNESDHIDVSIIQEAKRVIVTELRDIQIIKTRLTQICTTSNEIESMLTKIRKTILESLETVEEAINVKY